MTVTKLMKQLNQFYRLLHMYVSVKDVQYKPDIANMIFDYTHHCIHLYNIIASEILKLGNLQFTF